MSATDRNSYDELYRSTPAVWSGRPNRQLVVEAGDLPPGTALDAGCGEGGARPGWRLGAGTSRGSTSPPSSRTALPLQPAPADSIGSVGCGPTCTPGRRTGASTWSRTTTCTCAGPDGVLGRLATAVAPGGTLLVVGHLMSGDDDHSQHEHCADMLYTADDVAAVLDPAQWRGRRHRDP